MGALLGSRNDSDSIASDITNSASQQCLPRSSILPLKLFDAVVVLARDEGERHNTRNMHLGAKDMAVEVKLLEHGLDVLETFLVVGTCTTDPDLHIVLV